MRKGFKSLLCAFLLISMMAMGTSHAYASNVKIESTAVDNTKAENGEPLFKDVQHLSLEEEDELYQKYEEFLAHRERTIATCYSSNDHIMTSEQLLEDFADYAVKERLINNNANQKAGVKIAVVRASLKTVSTAGKACGYKIAAQCLNHSLQDSPSALYYKSGDMQAKQVMNTKEFKAVITKFRKEVKTLKKNTRNHSMHGSISLESNTDLYLAFHNMSYSLDAIRQGGRWAINIRLTDTYDFEYWEWSKKLASKRNAVVAINNYGAMAQKMGALVPYKITISVKYNVPI